MIVGFLLLTSLFYGQTDDNNDAYTLQHQFDSKDAWDRMFALGYVVGAADALESQTAICPRGVIRQGEFGEVVHKYINDDPTRLHWPRMMATVEALEKAYPCRKPAELTSDDVVRERDTQKPPKQK